MWGTAVVDMVFFLVSLGFENMGDERSGYAYASLVYFR